MTHLIGAHTSAAGGIDKAAERAASIGCNAVQLFTTSPRMWRPANLEKLNPSQFLETCAQQGIVANVIHAIYLVNLASDKPEQVEKSYQVLKADLEVAAAIKSVGVVVHLGSHQGRGYTAVKDQVVTQIKRLLSDTPDDGIFLIENSAGQNGKVPHNFMEIKELIDAVSSPRLGWCLDTCHAHAAGLPLNTLVQSVESAGLLSSLKCIHVNDSRDTFESHRDRHANLGQGLIDTENFKMFLQDSRIRHIPMMLEVPGYDNLGPDKQNIDTLKEWLDNK